MKFLTLAAPVIILLIAAIVILTPVRVFNALVPVDAGVERVARDIAYGNYPRQKLDIYRPTQASGVLPVIIFCYGGGWNSGDRESYGFVGRSLAAAGFLTIVIDYRHVPEIVFPAFVQDTAQAVRWSADNAASFGGDPERIFLMGHSAGAYNVVMATLDAKYLRDAGVPKGTVKGVVALSGPYDFLPLDVPSAVAAFSKWPKPAETQPINYARPDAPPMLLLTGTSDTTVFPRNSIELARRLNEQGADVQLKTYPGLGHAAMVLALSRPFRWRADVRDDVIAFIRELSGRSLSQPARANRASIAAHASS